MKPVILRTSGTCSMRRGPSQQIVGGVSRDEFLRNRTVQLAVERLLEVIGEAARRVSEAFRQAHPEIPWRRIVAQRNVLSHE
jgi:uncharacterized protein with HEPN domain